MRNYSITQALGLPEYKILDILSDTDEEIHIRIRAYKHKKAKCSGCGEYHNTKKAHSTKEIIVEDLRMFGKRVYLHVIKRRYRCLKDERLYVELIDWLKPRCRVTNRLAKEIYRLTSIATNQEAGWYLGMNDEKVYRIDKAMLEKLAEQYLKPTPASLNISVDEVAWKKHHRYLTNVIDVDKKVVTWNEKGRKAVVLDKYYESIGPEACKSIESAAMDGARTYLSSTKKYAINALIVLDRFHAVQKINKVSDQVRRDELSKARKNEDDELIALTNCKQRFILLKKRANLSDRQSVSLDKLCKINQPIYRALLLKENFLQTYECATSEEAEEHLYNWIDMALFSGLEPFFELACSVLDKIQYILNWFKKRISSAISEGFNNKIKRLKRMAYGYRDIEYFKLKIHQHCGYLNPRRFNLN
jgi:transposase